MFDLSYDALSHMAQRGGPNAHIAQAILSMVGSGALIVRTQQTNQALIATAATFRVGSATFNLPQTDLIFLVSRAFDEDMDAMIRWQILQHMNANDGRISVHDLERLGVDSPDASNFASFLELEYRASRVGTSFQEMDTAMRVQRQAEGAKCRRSVSS